MDFVAKAAHLLLYWILREWTNCTGQEPLHALLAALPQWANVELGLDDIPAACNSTPVVPEEAPANIAAVYDPQEAEWKFAEQDGLGFGLESAVTGFCRLPALATALSRRHTASLKSNYFDDLPTVDVQGSAGTGQQGTQAALSFVGADVGARKHAAHGRASCVPEHSVRRGHSSAGGRRDFHAAGQHPRHDRQHCADGALHPPTRDRRYGEASNAFGRVDRSALGT